MKRLTAYILITLMTALGASAQGGSWRLHLPFDEAVTRVIDTPDRTYFLGDAQLYLEYVGGNNLHLQTLFMYDKEGDEYRALNSDNILTESIIRTAAYNAAKRYLLVVYDSYNIDLVYDDGRVVNIPDLKAATHWDNREVSNINFDPERDRVYISTGTGLLTLNDSKAEVAEARDYGRPVTSAARIGDRLLISVDRILYQAPVDAPRFTLKEYEEIPGAVDVNMILPLSDTLCLYQRYGSDNRILRELRLNPDGTFTVGHDTLAISEDTYIANRDGYFIPVRTQVYQINRDGTWKRALREEEDNFCAAGSWDFNEIWFGRKREGYWSKRLTQNDDGNVWTSTRGAFRPNAPAPFRSTSMVYSPRYGMLVNSSDVIPALSSGLAQTPVLLSGLHAGEWTMFSPAYTYPEQGEVIYNPSGILFDPDRPSQVYFGSGRRGLLRIDLDDPSDVLHFSNVSDPSASLPGFVEAQEDLFEIKSGGINYDKIWNICRLSGPQFDAEGRMWMTGTYLNPALSTKNYLLCIPYWEAADRRASVDAASARGFKRLEIPMITSSEYARLWIPSGVPNTVMIFPNNYADAMLVVNHNGTPGTASDDKVQRITRIFDQDGTAVEQGQVTAFLNDPDTGHLWVGHTSGIFTMRPSDIQSDASRVNRIKVSRNDGTSLADYLLDGVGVTHIMRDPRGRKWISTDGGGVVCVSPDGREVILSLTASNSGLPSDKVLVTAWNPENASIMVGTDMGIAEYFPTGEGSTGEDFDAISVYPNPVRPDYLGWLTVEGLPEGAVVKIADAAGNVVADLGRASGGRAQWDITGRGGQRVASGVYHVLASSGADEKALGKVRSFVVMK
ncbi:MAG: hypothetical protein K2O24_02640 [Muribaculaceae bacterium]|nr:hypothetical protein [Muribaculaceae bacterium]